MGTAENMSMIDIDSVYTLDVTDYAEQVSAAQNLVATSYMAFSSGKISHDEVYRELCCDHYQQRNVVRTLLAYGSPSEEPEKMVPLGTTRIVLGSLASEHKDIEPLEAMDLVSPPEGWHDFRFCDFSAHRACEFGRYAVDPVFRGQKALTRHLCKQLVHAGICIAIEQYNANQFWAIMPQYFVRMMNECGLVTIPAPDIQLNTTKHSAFYKKYDKYWYHSKPWFYRIVA